MGGQVWPGGIVDYGDDDDGDNDKTMMAMMTMMTLLMMMMMTMVTTTSLACDIGNQYKKNETNVNNSTWKRTWVKSAKVGLEESQLSRRNKNFFVASEISS